MSTSENESVNRRFGADGDETTPGTPTDEVIVAEIPGDNPENFVTLTLAHPLNENDRRYLGLPADASTEVGQQVKVNRNGARALINAGLVTVDPEDNDAVRAALRGESAPRGASSEPEAEAPSVPAANPPKAPSTPVTDEQPVGEVQPPEGGGQAQSALGQGDGGEKRDKRSR